MYNLIVRPLLFLIDPEKVHRMLLNWLRIYRYLLPVRACVRGHYQVDEPFSYGSLRFKNRIGLSAGFDKNAETFDELADFGFGFLEVGTVTPDYQPGNPSSRIFRLVEDESLISRTGFNNCGVDVALEHIRKYRKHSYRLGVNINKNPLSAGEQIIKDFELVFTRLYESVDYFTLNWGSIDKESFAKVLENFTTFREAVNKRCSIFIKLPADIDEKELDLVISLAGCAVADGDCAFLAGNLNQLLCDQRTRHRCAQQVFVFVNSMCLYAGNDVFVAQFVIYIEDI